MTTEIEGIREDAPMIDATPSRGEMIRYTSETLAITREPEEVLADAQKAASALMKVVSSKKNQITFNGETYLESGDWQTVAKFYGVTAKVESTNYVQYGGAQGFEAAAVAIDCNGREVSRGEAMCLNDEENWGMRAKYEWQDVLDAQGKKIWEFNAAKGKNLPKRTKVQIGETATPLFQLRSMAQTRACAKALSNLFKWVVVLAGYKPTPAEEMTGTSEESQESQSTSHITPPQATSATSTTTSSATDTTTSGRKTDPSAISHQTGEPQIRPRSQKGTPAPQQTQQQAPEPQQPQGQIVGAEPVITDKQKKFLFAISKSLNLSDGDIKDAMNGIGLKCHRDEIPMSRFNELLDTIDPEYKMHAKK